MAALPPINSTHSLLSISVRGFFVALHQHSSTSRNDSLWQFSPSFKPWPPTRTCHSPKVPLPCRNRRSSSLCPSFPPHWMIARHTIHPAVGHKPFEEKSFVKGYRPASMRTPRLSQLPECCPPSGHISKSPSGPTKASLKTLLCSRRTWELSPGQHGHQMLTQSCKALFAALSRFLASRYCKTGPGHMVANF